MRLLCLLFVLLAALSSLFASAQHAQENYIGLQKFLSADIESAAWKVTIYDEEALAPGYWFVSPYEINGYKLPGASTIGPHIYDGNGELVWSGSHIFNRINVMDFGVMNVAGRDVLSMSYAVEGSGYLLDHGYQVEQTVFEGTTGNTFDMHDFHTVDNGKRFLYLLRNTTRVSPEIAKEDLGFDGKCSVTLPAFEEKDAVTGELLFKWDGTGKIPLSDSTMAFTSVENRCTGGPWDYLHCNAIDKLPDGHYLLSARHADTIYKISKDDGSIIWRLHGHGGDKSDFAMGSLNFSRQHDVRFRDQNETHIIISFLDNAIGADRQPATTPWSRGLFVALREDTMEAEIIMHIDQPHHEHAPRRGSCQPLPNGNVFMGWSERALQSEHTPDGELIMEAELVEGRLGTYRAFKFPFTANPDYPPDIYANTSSSGNITTTSVYASWNGATEVAGWTLYKTNKRGDRFVKLNSMTRSGFETTIDHVGYAKYVFVQAKDHNGKILGKSAVIETLVAPGTSAEAIAEELGWLQGDFTSKGWVANTLSNPLFIFAAGITCTAVAGILLATGYSKGSCFSVLSTYQRVPAGDATESEGTSLDDLFQSKSYDDEMNGDNIESSNG